MTDNNEHKLSDEELDAFLEGRHPVSQAYEDLDQVNSPAHLDERILTRARDSVANQKPVRKDVFIRPYATAATVFLCLAITFLYINEPGIPVPTGIQEADFTPQRSVSIPVDDDQAKAQDQAQDQDAAPVQLQRQAIENPTANANAPAPTTQPAPATQARERAEESANGAGATATPDRAAEVQPLLDLVEERRLDEADQDNTAEASQSAGFSAETDDNALEEITVTGSRILAEPDYRGARDSWLREIARLREAGDSETALEEETLFLARYPDTDIDSALEALDIP